MKINVELTLDDLVRSATGAPVDSFLSAESYLTGLRAWTLFSREDVIPACVELVTGLRRTCLWGLYVRALGFCESAVVLGKSPRHYQSLCSAERSVIELYVDMRLLQEDKVPDGVARFVAAVDIQKWKSARRLDDFLRTRPHLDPENTRAASSREFVHKYSGRIDKLRRAYFTDRKGRPTTPDHWTQTDILTRSRLLDEETECLVMESYDFRNFSVHSGLAGVIGMDQSGYEMQCAISLDTLFRCASRCLQVVQKEFQLSEVIEDFSRMSRLLDDIPQLALADLRLQRMGEASRVRILSSQQGDGH